MDIAITGLRLLTALVLMCVTYLVVWPYFAKPEEFFVKQLRPEANRKITHSQLLVRAFLGMGLITAGLHSLALCLVLNLVLHLTNIFWVWLGMTLGGGIVVGTGHYVVFRLLRYRKLDENACVFVQRKP